MRKYKNTSCILIFNEHVENFSKEKRKQNNVSFNLSQKESIDIFTVVDDIPNFFLHIKLHTTKIIGMTKKPKPLRGILTKHRS